jgi:maltooligosyltrehalose trehalohydrolase
MLSSPSNRKVEMSRRLPVGVEVVPRSESADSGVHARVWAPACKTVDLVVEGGGTFALEPDGNGYFAGHVASIGTGARYRFKTDGGESFPDPVSRFQPEGPHGPSEVVDHRTFEWSDRDWRGVSIDGQVIYELHIGTFTKAGTFRAAIERLPDLVDVGITVIEVMPVADFAGQFGWGYDGVNMFAPSRLYGCPDDFRAFIDAAHRLEMGVILDVVYNHFGPDGNYLPRFSPHYFSDKVTEWGASINFDGPGSHGVREFFVTNARYWIEEFHLDGLRLDATQQIWDESQPHILTEVTNAVRAAANGRATIVVGENEPQNSYLIRPCERGGCGVDALWNDDFHHSAVVAATGRSEAYYTGYAGAPQEFISAAKYGFLYQGEYYMWQHGGRGTPTLDLPPSKFVNFTQNHDQIANSANGKRLHQESSPGRTRALTALLLLSPQTPMLFQGQEFGASTEFHFFADHGGELGELVRKGRSEFMAQFWSICGRDPATRILDPSHPSTFVKCKLDWSEREKNTAIVDLHRDLLRLRREDPVLRQRRQRGVDGAVLGPAAFVLRFFGDDGDDRLLLVNFGGRFHADPMPEPLLAPPLGMRWTTLLSTDDQRYGGWGTPPLPTPDLGWWIPNEFAALLAPADARQDDAQRRKDV